MIAWWWDPWSFWWAVFMDIVGRERIAQLEDALDAIQLGLDGIRDWAPFEGWYGLRHPRG